MIYNFSKHLISITFIVCLIFNTEGQNSIQDSIQDNLKHNEKLHKILFIGNSVIATNDLPLIVQKKAKNYGYSIETKMIALPDYEFSDHWNKGEVQNLIRSKVYDIVVIQQNPTNRSNSYEKLVDYGKRYSDICKENNVLLAYFMVWPSLENIIIFDTIILNYELISETYDDILCPVGKVWKKHFETTRKYDYYESDNFLPSKKGSEIAAQVVLSSLLKYLR